MNDFLTLAAERYSVRKFTAAPVEQEKIEKILEAANLAPTACNYQPQKIYVVQSEQMRQALATATPCTFNAPVVFAVGYDKERSAKGMIRPGHDFGDTDAAIVCTHMMLESKQLGLGSCWVGYFSEEKVAAALGIPEGIAIRDLLPVGYEADDSKPAAMHSKYRSSEEMVAFL